MPRLPDQSDFYTAESATDADVGWVLEGHWRRHLEFLLPRLPAAAPPPEVGAQPQISVLEFGCGTGLLASVLPRHLVREYEGVDKNAHFLAKARRRNPDGRFVCFDVRNYEGGVRDVVLAFNFMKHFALSEWARVLAEVLRHGHYAAFNMQLADNDFDDGVDYHHVFVTEATLRSAVMAAGHELLDLIEDSRGTAAGGDSVRVVNVWTKRTADVPAEPTLTELVSEHLKSVTLTGPDQVRLVVDGREVKDLAIYAVRWCDDPKSSVALYRNGRRVTKAWRLTLNVSVPADPRGENANTAEG